METWFLSLVALSISVLITLFVFNPFSKKLSHNLPPGPPTIPIIGNLLLFFKSFHELESILRNLHKKYGPILTLKIGSKPAIFIANGSLAHQALIKNSSIFADRPPVLLTDKIISNNQHNINTAFHSPTWRLLRRNLTSKILNPPQVKSYSHARKWVLEILIGRLKSHSKSGVICVVDHLRYAMFCLLALMCFGKKLEEEQIKEIVRAQRNLLLSLPRFRILNVWPTVGKILFRKRWEELFQMIRDRGNVLIPLIRARKVMKQEKVNTKSDPEQTKIKCYVDTLFDLEVPEEKRKLEESELVGLCTEFLDGGTSTTITALQWIFANLVKNPEIQGKLYMEMKQNLSEKYLNQEEIKEEDLQKLPYLKAVVLEGLRRHPPGHFVLPHAVTEDTVLNGYLVPRNCVVNVTVAEIGLDPEVWEDPMAFKPERFLRSNGEEIEFDITGSTEIKMMPFGVGRRICPGMDLAMLHLVYFVGNLVWNFKWSSLDGEDVDLREKQEFFTYVMEKPLQAHLSPRN
ncbi:cytochrome P450 89A2-like [Mangifera indica]|uniref:cytochrome P450 89A2-like n=1 Tax=Mangifera indica TaxID=29780 RepID=UPI001CFBB138|nr:cytochrome P450 89A2-like [Mangifera indica]